MSTLIQLISSNSTDRPAGGGEPIHVWRERWGDVLGVLGSLAAVNPPKKMERLRPVIQQYQIPQHVQHRTSPPQQGTMSANLAAALGSLDPQVSPTRPRSHMRVGLGEMKEVCAGKGVRCASFVWFWIIQRTLPIA
jgi:hypothetical protein